ncbi:MAG: cobalamin biosynthesis protein CobD [Acidobacteria bacterium]|nr:cobalamin biosynthesis protein CobD [Acidobacteriota bacterium]
MEGRVIAAAYVVDCVLGDPEWLPHPVRLMGKVCDRGEALLRRPRQSAAVELAAGAALTAAMIAGFYVVTAEGIRAVGRRSRVAGAAVEVALAWTCLAGRSLLDEGAQVIAALEADDLERARARLARIVGRDTAALDASEICRTLIETLAESSCDGIVAPLFYLAVGGVPLAMAYKTVNTLDSMIGHADERYLYFGKAAARLDDLANLLPARLAAMGVAAVASILPEANGAAALRLWQRDGDRHKSPNAGQPEAAMAGALEVRLGGTNTYRGEVMHAPEIGAELPVPSLREAKLAMRIVGGVTLLGVLAAVLVRAMTSPGAGEGAVR